MLPDKIRLPQKKSALARARERFAKRQEEKRGPPRIGFAIDATGSRGGTWRQAQTIQARMFRAVASLNSLSLRLIHFGGNRVTDHGWMTDPEAVAAQMARVRCVMGYTQIIPALTALLDDAKASRAQTVILIGDAFEESPDEAHALALALRDAGIKVFSFIEGGEPAAADVFRRFAETTGGRFAKFGDDLPLADLCEGVALLTSGGAKALTRIENKKVRLLLAGPSKG